MPARTTKKQREAEEKQVKEVRAARRARQAGPDGLSPERGWGGTPFYPEKPGHHWEQVLFGGQREYRDSETVHLDRLRDPGSQEFPCRLHIPMNADIPVNLTDLPSLASGLAQGVGVHRDPALDVFDLRVHAAIGFEQHVDVDLTRSPSLGPQMTHGLQSAPVLVNNKPTRVTTNLPRSGPQLTQDPLPAPVLIDHKPSRVNINFHAYIPNGLSAADMRSGTPQTYADHAPKEPFLAMLQIHGVSLEALKKSLFKACSVHKKGCGSLLQSADEQGQLVIKCFVHGPGPFCKTTSPQLSTKAIFDEFKIALSFKKGKEVGFRLLMQNPKTTTRTTSKIMEFDQALAHKNPDVLDPDRLAELEMATIGVNRDFQSYATTLMAKYGHVSIDGKECMGCINPGNPCEVIYLSHTLMDVWAEDLRIGRQGVTLMKPPPEFPRVLINPKPNRKHPNPSTSESRATTSEAPIVPSNSNTPHQIRPDSPAPRPLPDFEDYLAFCSITADDRETRDLLDRLKITTFEIFLSPYFDYQKMEEKGFSIGAAIRLHDSAPLYRNHLKNLKRPRF